MLVPTQATISKDLKHSLRDFPQRWQYDYSHTAKQSLLQTLFRSLVGQNAHQLDLLFCGQAPGNDGDWTLRDAQGALEGAEYTESARGKPCGHILKGGEASYRCKTCTNDDTCVLCSRCFEATDHTGHTVSVHISPGNSGCCDCGDPEAWNRPVHCAIHTPLPSSKMGERAETPQLPPQLVTSIQGTVSAAIDYVCDVISCAPEELRKPKTEESIKRDQTQSELLESVYGESDEMETNPLYAMVLWNDEKHSVEEVEEQVARACKRTKDFGLEKAHETDDVGRSVIMVSRDLPDLLHKAKIIEQIKITVTIRSARDTFREQMCSTIIEWLLDISACSVGDNHDILRQTICEEMLKPWEQGSSASNARIGRDGIYDHEIEDSMKDRGMLTFGLAGQITGNVNINNNGVTITVLQNNAAAQTDEGEEEGLVANMQDAMDVDQDPDFFAADQEMRADDADGARGEPDDTLEHEEATMAGYPPPPPPPAGGMPTIRPGSEASASASSRLVRFGEELRIPQTPMSHARRRAGKAPVYWLEREHTPPEGMPLAEDIEQRLRLDWMILYDLRLWKKARIDLRDLYIGTVVTIPEFKRILGLRFAGLYTLLAQLYLIADREPDHSIIYLSLQMLTTPSITKEVVDKCNFLTVLVAILYTFLTTRQVGGPFDVSTNATLAFDAGSVTNRRMYHFFMDLKHLFSNLYVQEQLRENDNYTLQFLDLIKLSQGICPNTRAVGDHVEYENDAWIGASILTKEMNRLCRQFAEAFKLSQVRDRSCVAETIRRVSLTTLIHSLGLENRRFRQAEIKHPVRFHELPIEFWGEHIALSEPIVKFTVEDEPISFHHPMHYTLSWLIDGAKSISAGELRDILSFRAQDLVSALSSIPNWGTSVLKWDPATYLLVLFDYPLRVCAWLAQMRAGMWVRNGLSLRHQMSQYRSVHYRNLAHQHDLYLLQVALVICEPNRILASMIDRFSLRGFMCGFYDPGTIGDSTVPTDFRCPYEEHQLLDIVEDFVHLLIILLSERSALQPLKSDEEQQEISMRRDLTHVLCFKPLSYSDLCARLVDRFQDLDEFPDILSEMTNYKAPEGISDVGTFELKKEYLTGLDPYIAQYTKNQRDEAEIAYKNWIAEKTGKPLSDVVFEPELRKIESGIFTGLAEFVGTPIFIRIIRHCLAFAVKSSEYTPNIPATRIESLLQVVLHLLLISVKEDPHQEDGMVDEPDRSLVYRLLTRPADSEATISLLFSLLSRKEYEACHSKIRSVMRHIQQKRPKLFQSASEAHDVLFDDVETESRADPSGDQVAKKKAAALARANKVMASFKQQQHEFLAHQSSIDWGLDDDESVTSEGEEALQMWDYPKGNCIYCQEECGDENAYGTFALIQESNILRLTDISDNDFIREAIDLPGSLDSSAESIRPYGLAGKNFDTVKKFNSEGQWINVERQTLGKGWKPDNYLIGPVSRSCGHIMHYQCFELYFNATIRRQQHQIARKHPERLQKNEFVCPLCKALANTFVPILRKGAEKRPMSTLDAANPFEEWLLEDMKNEVVKKGKVSELQSDSTSLTDTPGTSIDWAPETLASGPLFGSEASTPMAQMTPNTSRASSMSPIVSGIANMPGNFVSDDSLSLSPPTGLSSQLGESTVVVSICHRLLETMQKNDLISHFEYVPSKDGRDQLCHTDVLGHTIGHTIGSVEISQRGIASEGNGPYVNTLSAVTLTHLRLIRDFFNVYTATGRVRNRSGRAEDEMNRMAQRQLQQLFGGHPKVFDSQPSTYNVTPALALDPFVFLAETPPFFGDVFGKNFQHMIKLCYLLDLVKNAHAIWRNVIDGMNLDIVEREPSSPQEAELASSFLDFLLFCGLPQIANHALLSSKSFALYAVSRLRPYALVFLRKVALWVHVVKDIDFSSSSYSEGAGDELDRLTEALRVPTLHQMLRGAGTSSNAEAVAVLHSIVLAWVADFYKTFGTGSQSSLTFAGRFASRPCHPAIFELVGLPKYFDTLLDEMMRRRCSTKPKRDLSDPALCLFCGDIFCGQAACCTQNGKGGCNRHMEKCGKNVGLFLILRKCTVLYLSDTSGTFIQAPYLDRHGEADQGLRRNRQLMLNQKRYDTLLRSVWLHHMIPTTIARKLEADINNGGWETM